MAEQLEHLLTSMAAAEPKIEAPDAESETDGFAWKITYSTYRA
jgi:hypothetical protein